MHESRYALREMRLVRRGTSAPDSANVHQMQVEGNNIFTFLQNFYLSSELAGIRDYTGLKGG
jgi:hypothetical protein